MGKNRLSGKKNCPPGKNFPPGTSLDLWERASGQEKQVAWVEEYFPHLINLYLWIYQPRVKNASFPQFVDFLFACSQLSPR